jgi:Domain of unknown function (DUF4160)
MAQRIGKPYDIRLEKDLRTRSRGSRAVASQPERYAWIPEFAKNNHADHLDVFWIIIRMYFGDHNPPHFHVEFQGEKAMFTLTVGCGLEIFLPGLPESWCGTGLVVIDSNS